MDATALVALIQTIPIIGPYAVWLPILVVIAATLGVFLPAPEPNARLAYRVLYAAVQWCALNKGQAVNLTSPRVNGLVGGPFALSAPAQATASVRVPQPTPVPPGTTPSSTAGLFIVMAAAALSLAACTPAQLATTQAQVSKATTTAQLYCKIATAAGPLTVALVSAAHPQSAPVAATTEAATLYACSLVDGIPAAASPAGTVAPAVAVPGALPTVPAS